MLSTSIFVALVGALAAQAAPPALLKRQSITALSTAQISTFKPFTFFASTAYCQPSTTLTWSCGANCNANADFIPVASGGDGASVQFWYVGFSPSQASVIVAHQGTDSSKIQADATDADAFLGTLDSTLFPGVSSSVEVHSGFRNEQAKTANQILTAVRTAISAHSATRVTVVGHSLGAAIALLDGVYLPLHISGVTFSTIVYGLPGVGNQAFANYLMSTILNVTSNFLQRKDIVPLFPGQFLGYHQPSGEVHIAEDNSWLSCPGQDNPSTQCAAGDVRNIFQLLTHDDHGGPYDGVNMGC
ncbi:lipase class 3 family protein [Crucibulum laeve]|uniref:Lipase class 3 family protein n=1 Tax=Crucibulum laeve TaxID=68775 RepID=A0A5C3M9F5_9AGAR|nr:lipase class 3 family protein [Crucibulum laeve]